MKVGRDGDELLIEFERDAFATVGFAIEHARFSLDALGAVVRTMEHRLRALDKPLALWVMAAVQRTSGLHVALVRETSWNNPHAVFALERALADTVLVALQVRRDPAYARIVMSDPAKYPPARRRLKSQALIAAAKRELPGMRDAWDYLSESGGHFGWAAFQTSYLPRRLPDGLVHVKITTGPGWRDPKMKLASYGQITELTLIAAVAIAGIIGADPVAAIESIEPPRRTQDREETGDR